MFKFETFVKAVVLVAFTFITLKSLAQSSDDSDTDHGSSKIFDARSNCKPLEDQVGKAITDGKSKAIIDDLKTERDSCYSRAAANPINCGSATEDYKSAKAGFQSACTAIPTSDSDKSKPGNVACAYALMKCANMPKIKDSSYNGMDIDTVAARKRFSYCPMLAGKDLAALEDEIKDGRNAIREMKGKIPQLMDGLADAQSQTIEKKAEADKQRADAFKEKGKALKEARNQKDQAQGQLVEQMLQLQSELSKAEEKRGQVRIQRAEAAAARAKSIGDIDLRCHEEASLSVRKLQEQRLALESSRQYNRGGFGQMLKAVGVSDREAWQRVAGKYFRWCMQSSPTRKLKEQANDVYEVAQKRADEAEQAIEREKADLRNRISKIKNSSGCLGGPNPDSGGEPTESAMCRATRNAIEDAAQAESDYRADLAKADAAAAAAEAQGNLKAGAKMAALANAQRDISDENARLRNLAEFLSIKRQLSGGKEVTEDEQKEARKKYETFLTRAKGLYHCIKPSDANDKRSKEQICGETPECREAVNLSALVDNEYSIANEVNKYDPNNPQRHNLNQGTQSTTK